MNATEKKRKLMTETTSTKPITTMLTTQEEQSVFLLPQQFCGNDINQKRWNFLINKLSENEENNINLNITNLFKLYNNITLCQWIPQYLLLLNVFRYLNNKPLILIKLNETSAFRSQLNYYSLIMDDNYLDEIPIFWTGFYDDKSFFHPFTLTFNEGELCIELVRIREKEYVNFNWNIVDGFYLTIGNKTIILSELGDCVEFDGYMTMQLLKYSNERIKQKQVKK
ncbi:hypothetical protein ABK040_013641 [Willaertia magna]